HKLVRQVVENDLHFLSFQANLHLFHLKIDNLQEVRLLERVEDSDLVEAIEKLRFKDAFGLVQNLFPHRIVIVSFTRSAEAHCCLFLEQLGPNVRRHDDDRVSEIDLPA